MPRPDADVAGSGGRRSAQPAGWTARVPSVFAAVLGVLAALCAVAAVSEAAFARSQPIREGINDVFLPAPANLAYAAFVGILAVSVERRKRLAFKVLLIYFGIQIVSDLGALALLGSVVHFASHLTGLTRAPWYAASSTAKKKRIALKLVWF